MSGPPTPLSDMLKQASANGQTYERLAARAIDPATGARLSRSNLHKIANGQAKHIPSPDTLAAIAAALDVRYEDVWLAAIVEYMPPGDDEVTAALQRLLTDRRAEAALERARRLVADEEADAPEEGGSRCA